MDFSDIFRAELKRAKLTHAAFADRVGVSPAFVSLVATKRNKLPMDRADKWADELGLTGTERRWFIMHAGLAHIPDPAVANAISEELISLTEKVASLAERVRRIR